MIESIRVQVPCRCLLAFWVIATSIGSAGAAHGQEIRALDIPLELYEPDRLFVPGGLTSDGRTFAATTLGTTFPNHSSAPYLPGFIESGGGEAIPLVDLASGEILATATDISPDGSVVTGSARFDQPPSTLAEAAIWRADGTIERLGRLPGAPSQVSRESIAWAASRSGDVVVGNSENEFGEAEAFRWTADWGMEGLGFLTGPGTYEPGERNGFAIDVSADGGTIVGNSDRAAFVFDDVTGMRSLGFLDSPGGNPRTHATAISEDGAVVVGAASSSGGMVAFRWTESTGLVPISPTYPTGVSFGGIPRDTSRQGREIVGTYRDENGLDQAFIWTETSGFTQLAVFLASMGVDVSEWLRLESALGISADGRTIAGVGVKEIDDRLRHEVFIATIPEPSTAALLMMGLVLVPLLRSERVPRVRAD